MSSVAVLLCGLGESIASLNLSLHAGNGGEMVWALSKLFCFFFAPSFPSVALHCPLRSLGLPSIADKNNKRKKFPALLSALCSGVLVNV